LFNTIVSGINLAGGVPESSSGWSTGAVWVGGGLPEVRQLWVDWWGRGGEGGWVYLVLGGGGDGFGMGVGWSAGAVWVGVGSSEVRRCVGPCAGEWINQWGGGGGGGEMGLGCVLVPGKFSWVCVQAQELYNKATVKEHHLHKIITLYTSKVPRISFSSFFLHFFHGIFKMYYTAMAPLVLKATKKPLFLIFKGSQSLLIMMKWTYAHNPGAISSVVNFTYMCWNSEYRPSSAECSRFLKSFSVILLMGLDNCACFF
jgi:hypothetical protein